MFIFLSFSAVCKGVDFETEKATCARTNQVQLSLT
jgi:hypothetical protein